jgi:hypothetical protein
MRLSGACAPVYHSVTRTTYVRGGVCERERESETARERERETLNADPNMSVILILILILIHRGIVCRGRRHYRDGHAADRLPVYLQRPDSFDQGPCRAGDSGLAQNI